jgi:hypothetical protein
VFQKECIMQDVFIYSIIAYAASICDARDVERALRTFFLVDSSYQMLTDARRSAAGTDGASLGTNASKYALYVCT